MINDKKLIIKLQNIDFVNKYNNMEKLKTIADVMRTPQDKCISIINWNDFICPFCGSKLPFQVIGFGRNKCHQYLPCICQTAQAA